MEKISPRSSSRPGLDAGSGSAEPGGVKSALARVSMRQLGMLVLLASITVLFAATLVGYVFTRVNAPGFRAPGLPDLPLGLVGSTLFIALTSAAIFAAQRAVRRNRLETVYRALSWAAVFASVFLVLQASNWLAMRPPTEAPSLYLSTFYLLTGIHALHVLGGYVPLAIVIHHAKAREYSSSRHEGLTLCAQYWHYLGVVWLVLLAALYAGSGS